MKNVFRFLVLALVSATVFSACNKEQLEEAAPGIQNNDQEQVFTFAIGSNSGATKSVLSSDAKGRFVQFDADDTGNNNGIGSIAPNAQGYSSVTPASGENPATFSIYTKGVTAGDAIYVWYPYRTTQTDATAVELVIPAEQHHKTNNAFDMKAMPMVTKKITVTSEMAAATSNNRTPIATINFANMGSLLNFKVFSSVSDTYEGEKVKSITFNAKNAAGTADALIGGTFVKDLTTLDPQSEGTMTIPNFKENEGVSSIVTYPVADAAIGTNKDKALNLYMVVAPGEYKGTIVVLTDAAEYTYTINNKATLVRSGVKAYGLDLNSNNVARVEKVTVDYVALPWNYAGGTAADLNAVVGVTTSGLGSDYGNTHAPCQVKFDGDGDYIMVKTDAAISTVSVGYKMIGGNSTSHLYIYESTDGAVWGEKIDDLTISGAQNSTGTVTTTADFNPSSRFVKIEFKKGANVGIGTISIGKASTSTDPVITLSNIPSETVAAAGDVLSVNYSVANPVAGKSISASADVSWINTFDYSTAGEIQFVVDENSGANSEARSGVVTVAYEGATSKTFTVNQAGNKVVVDWVSLDWDYAGGTSNDLKAVVGVTTEGLGSDYAESHAPYRVKFDTDDDYIQVKTDQAISTVSVGYKKIGGEGVSHLYIYESIDGTNWGEKIDDLSISGSANSTGTVTTTADFNSSSRFVKIVFKKAANVGIGAISIHKVSPVIFASNVTDFAAAGGNSTLSYTAKYFTDDVEVGNTTGCVSSATVSTSSTVSYTIAPNYTTSAASGTIVLQSASNNTITKTVNVSQLGSSLAVSTSILTIPATSTTATFTVTSAELGYNAVVASTETGMNLSVSGGASGLANPDEQTVTISSTTDAPTSGEAITLGTISVYRNNNSSDPQIKTITVKKAVAGATTYTLTFPDDNSSKNGLTSNQYVSTWTAKSGTFSWSISNFNNNNWQNNWQYIKCGRKNNASVASIITSSSIPEAIKTVKITIDAVTADKINSIKLYISSDGSAWNEEGSFTIASGEQPITISNPTTDKYYKLEFDCASGSSNGLLTLSKVVYTTN